MIRYLHFLEYCTFRVFYFHMNLNCQVFSERYNMELYRFLWSQVGNGFSIPDLRMFMGNGDRLPSNAPSPSLACHLANNKNMF